MTQDEFAIPPLARELAAKGVEQARKSFDSLAGATQTAINSTGTHLPSSAREFNGRIFSLTEQNVKDLFDLAQNVIEAKSMDEVLKLQTEFMARSADKMQKQAGELTASIQALAVNKE
jgi:hypothetical protein